MFDEINRESANDTYFDNINIAELWFSTIRNENENVQPLRKKENTEVNDLISEIDDYLESINQNVSLTSEEKKNYSIINLDDLCYEIDELLYELHH